MIQTLIFAYTSETNGYVADYARLGCQNLVTFATTRESTVYTEMLYAVILGGGSTLPRSLIQLFQFLDRVVGVC